MSKKKIVTTTDAPRAGGPYSQGVIAGGMLYVAGQVPKDPATNQLIGGTIAEQTARVLDNVTAVLRAAGAERGDVVRAGVYLADIKDFAEMNAVFAQYFPEEPPARTTIQATLAAGVGVEIDVVAVLE